MVTIMDPEQFPRELCVIPIGLLHVLSKALIADWNKAAEAFDQNMPM